MSNPLSATEFEQLDSITDPWELLEALGLHRRMRLRAAYYSRFIALVANQPSAQQHMLTYEAHRVFRTRTMPTSSRSISMSKSR